MRFKTPSVEAKKHELGDQIFCQPVASAMLRGASIDLKKDGRLRSRTKVIRLEIFTNVCPISIRDNKKWKIRSRHTVQTI